MKKKILGYTIQALLIIGIITAITFKVAGATGLSLFLSMLVALGITAVSILLTSLLVLSINLTS